MPKRKHDKEQNNQEGQDPPTKKPKQTPASIYLTHLVTSLVQKYGLYEPRRVAPGMWGKILVCSFCKEDGIDDMVNHLIVKHENYLRSEATPVDVGYLLQESGIFTTRYHEVWAVTGNPLTEMSGEYKHMVWKRFQQRANSHRAQTTVRGKMMRKRQEENRLKKRLKSE
eukprot:comp9016_c0_seq1/m.4209 comp9016_c0_seq1/g.4209  ORF comp9016_c0_seq1/g.4209 comp9016_c0_seq1/m.4209 type:complete len:169 (-) comp9016_c0_seq1:222-728(-)